MAKSDLMKNVVESLDNLNYYSNLAKFRGTPYVFFGSDSLEGAVRCIKHIIASLMVDSDKVNAFVDETGLVTIQAIGLNSQLKHDLLNFDGLLEKRLSDSALKYLYIVEAVSSKFRFKLHTRNGEIKDTENILDIEAIEGVRTSLHEYVELIENTEEGHTPDYVEIQFRPSHGVFNYTSLSKKSLNFLNLHIENY